MRRRQFYDPEIQTAPPEPDPIEVRGVMIAKPGAYVHISDVAAVLMRLAEQTHDAGREALVMAASCFTEGDFYDEPMSELGEVSEPESKVSLLDEPGTLERGSDDSANEKRPSAPGSLTPYVRSGIARVEVYPNEDASYWYARAVTATGEIINGETASGISRGQLERDIERRWPGVPVHEIPDAMGDSIWDEQSHVFGFNGRRRPSPRRIWQQ